MNMVIIGTILKDRIKAKGYTQEEFCELVGIGLSYILCIPINLILNAIFPEYGIGNIASLNPLHAFLLILLSVGLTYIASVIPSRVAAEKDPVIALRTE